jgi:hypothetical protein
MRNALILSLVLAACSSDPPAPSEVRARITDDLGNVLRETNAAATTLDTMPGTASLAMLDRVFDSHSDVISAKISHLSQLVAPRTDVRSADTGVHPADELVNADEAIAFLNEHVFTDANETSPGVYTLGSDALCDAGDQECADQLAKLDLRIVVSEHGDALEFALQLDKNHDEPLVVSLAHARLAATLDLDEAQQAITTLAPVLGEQPPNLTMAGELTASIDILGPANAKLGLAIDRDLAIATADLGVTSAAADVLALTLDAPQHAATLAIGLGATTVHLADADVIDLDLPGATALAMFAQGQPLTLSNLGLGDRSTTVTVNGRRAITIDLNPQDGRSFGATITGTAADETIAVSPKLDLRSQVDHGALGDGQPVYDVTQVLLTGSLRGSDASDRIEVASGTFSIATNPSGFGFAATAGQCVSASQAEDATSGAFYTAWSVGACN